MIYKFKLNIRFIQLENHDILKWTSITTQRLSLETQIYVSSFESSTRKLPSEVSFSDPTTRKTSPYLTAVNFHINDVCPPYSESAKNYFNDNEGPFIICFPGRLRPV